MCAPRLSCERVLQLVVVSSAFDSKTEGARDPEQRSRSGVGHDRDRELLRPLVHGSRVLEHEGPLFSMEPSGDALDGYVARRALGWCKGGEHLTLSNSDEVTFESLVQGHASKADTFRDDGLGLRLHLNDERSQRGCLHVLPSLGVAGSEHHASNRRERLPTRGLGLCARDRPPAGFHDA